MLDINVHKTVLVKILKDIYTDIKLGNYLGFKGGTALYFFYSLPRFSTDLDFDLINPEKELFVLEKLESIVSQYGKITQKENKANTVFLLLSYGVKNINIKIEISKRNFGSRYEVKNYLGVSIKTMVAEDMFAHKLTALLERNKTASRDLYDVWFFLTNHFAINEKIVLQRTKENLKQYLEKCVAFVEKYPDNRILAGIGELIDNKTKSWVKNKLKEELLLLLKLKIEWLK